MLTLLWLYTNVLACLSDRFRPSGLCFAMFVLYRLPGTFSALSSDEELSPFGGLFAPGLFPRNWMIPSPLSELAC